MKLIGFCLLSVALFALPASFAATEPAESGDLQRLQGTWQIQWWEQEGKITHAADLKDSSIFFGDNTFFIREGRTFLQSGTQTLDGTKNPKQITAVVKEGAHKGSTMLGIYELRGEVLRICFAIEGIQRPTAFRTTPASGQFSIECKRKPPAPEEALDITGSYRVETAELADAKQVVRAVIERQGDAYRVIYKKDNRPIYTGIGLRQGNVFSLSWTAQGISGVSLYRIEKGPRLVGQYTFQGGSGVVATETLTPVEKGP